MKNIRLKILSLFFAFILWIFATTGRKAEIGIIVPVVLKNIPKNTAVIDLKPNSIDVRVSGPKSLLRTILDRDIKLSINLSNFRSGVVRYKITGLEFNLPRGLVVKSVEPKVVEILLEDIISKRVKVKPVIKGKPKKLYKISDVFVYPEYVSAKGPKRFIKNLNYVQTDPVDVSNKSSSFISKVKLPKHLSHISFDPDEVEVRVVLKPVVGRKNFILPLSPPAKNIRLSARRLKVTLKGPLVLLKDMSIEDIQVNLSIDKRKKRGYIRPTISLKKGVKGISVVSISPRKIKYVVR